MSGALVVQHDIGYALQLLVTSNGYGWQCQFFGKGCVSSDEALNASRQEHLRVGLKQFRVVPVDYRQEEVVVPSQVFFNATDHHGAVGVANLFSDDPNRVSSLESQGSREEVGPVVESLRRLDNAILGVFGNRAGSRRVI